MGLARAATLLLLVACAFPPRAEARRPRSPDVVAGAWIEERDGGELVVVALYRRAGSAAPAQAHVGFSEPDDRDLPSGYGTIPRDAWRAVQLPAGVLVRVERALRPGEAARPPAVLVTATPVTQALEVYPLIVDEVPDGTLLFARPQRETVVKVARHVLEVGEATEVTLAAPPADFLLPETLEVAVVSRRLGLDGAQADGEAGHVDVEWIAPQGPPPLPAAELHGPEGEQRIRAHFTDPRCAWAERHVAWREARWVLEYAALTPLTFRLTTTSVRRPGVVSDLWQGYGALTVEAIYPNGFGGSSANHDLPALLVVPKGTAVRTAAVPR